MPGMIDQKEDEQCSDKTVGAIWMQSGENGKVANYEHE